MSFLSELLKQKNTLKKTDTVVTKIDGQRFVEKAGMNDVVSLTPSYGFVVDTKPDNIPVEIVKHLYIGSQDCTAADILKSYNIRHVLTLGIEIDICNVNYKFVECLDLPETSISHALLKALPFIHNAVVNKTNILVHCNAGVSRTSMIAIGYLILYENMSYNEAYTMIKEKRPAIRPNDGFIKQLKSLDITNLRNELKKAQ